MTTRTGHLLLAMALAASAVAAAAGLAAQGGAPGGDLSAYLPPGPGRELIVPSCAGCHDLRGTLQLRQSEQAWEAMVLDMGARGAPIAVDDVAPIAKYLASAFGPKAPPFTDVNGASREELLKVPGVTAAGADRLIAERTNAPLASHEQVRAALGLEAQAFEKIRPYLYVNPEQKGGR